MQPPYDTSCRDKHPDMMFTCRYNCLVHRFKSHRIMLPDAIVSHPLDYRIIGSQDIQHPDNITIVSQVDKECQARCHFIPCLQKFSLTATMSSLVTDVVLGFEMRSPNEPDMSTVALPVMHFVEFFSFLCSCFGTWFGISFLSLDPFKKVPCKHRWARRRKSKSKLRTRHR